MAGFRTTKVQGRRQETKKLTKARDGDLTRLNGVLVGFLRTCGRSVAAVEPVPQPVFEKLPDVEQAVEEAKAFLSVHGIKSSATAPSSSIPPSQVICGLSAKFEPTITRAPLDLVPHAI